MSVRLLFAVEEAYWVRGNEYCQLYDLGWNFTVPSNANRSSTFINKMRKRSTNLVNNSARAYECS